MVLMAAKPHLSSRGSAPAVAAMPSIRTNSCSFCSHPRHPQVGEAGREQGGGAGVGLSDETPAKKMVHTTCA